jgi:hypothetical protein
MRATLGHFAFLVLVSAGSLQAKGPTMNKIHRYFGLGWGPGYHAGWTHCDAPHASVSGWQGPTSEPPVLPAKDKQPIKEAEPLPSPMASRAFPSVRTTSSPRGRIFEFVPATWFAGSTMPNAAPAPAGDHSRVVRLPPVESTEASP